MTKADGLRAALRVAELEAALAAAKESGDGAAAVKEDLRYARWVARGGPAEEAQRLDEHAKQETQRQRLVSEQPELADLLPPLAPAHTNRHVADLYARWLDEQEG